MYKTNTKSILMHQVSISTNDVQAKNVGNPETKCENCKRAANTQTEYYEVEPNPSKDRAMHEGDNPLF
jgi:hypothetical protein